MISIADTIQAAREAQTAWRITPLRRRLKLIRRLRQHIVERSGELTASVSLPQRTHASDTLASEVIPLAEACRFLEKSARKILATPLLKQQGPKWLPNVLSEIRREPFGVVLVIGTWNYPLLLTGVHALQALTAGNAVLVKPGRGASDSIVLLRQMLIDAGLDERLVQVLPESAESARSAIEQGVDKVVLTGSAATGRAVLTQLAETATPSVMELSGCDAMFVHADADLDRVAKSLAFGLRFNSSATCIAPRRVLIDWMAVEDLKARLQAALEPLTDLVTDDTVVKQTLPLIDEAIKEGAMLLDDTAFASWRQSPDEHDLLRVRPLVLVNARAEMRLLKSDVFAPVVSLVAVANDHEALEQDRLCPFALGASVFGPRRDAERLAGKIDAGCVVVNDVIAPTADPCVPFGGRKRSGFGVTRGPEGLREMTQVKTIIVRHGKWLPHLEQPTPDDEQILTHLLTATHGRSFFKRLSGWDKLIHAAAGRWWRRRKSRKEANK